MVLAALQRQTKIAFRVGPGGAQTNLRPCQVDRNGRLFQWRPSVRPSDTALDVDRPLHSCVAPLLIAGYDLVANLRFHFVFSFRSRPARSNCKSCTRALASNQ